MVVRYFACCHGIQILQKQHNSVSNYSKSLMSQQNSFKRQQSAYLTHHTKPKHANKDGDEKVRNIKNDGKRRKHKDRV